MSVDANDAVMGLRSAKEQRLRTAYPDNAKGEHELSVIYKPLEPLEFRTNHSRRSWIISEVEFLWGILRECMSMCVCVCVCVYAQVSLHAVPL